MKLHGEGARIRAIWRPWVIKRYLRDTDRPRLHIGCGGRIVEGWLNVDRYSGDADTYLNAYSRFPFKDSSFVKVFSEHMVEHLEIDRVQHFLSEVHRILKPEGIFRVTCPDLALYANNYVNNTTPFFQQVLIGIEGKRERRPRETWVVRNNGGAFMSSVVKNFHKHRWMYDFETLASCLKEVGFHKANKQTYNHSQDEELAKMDNPDRSFETLYVDAVKSL